MKEALKTLFLPQEFYLKQAWHIMHAKLYTCLA